MKKALVVIAALTLSLPAFAAEEEEIPAKSLPELLQLVQDGKIGNNRINQEREREFLAKEKRPDLARLIVEKKVR